MPSLRVRIRVTRSGRKSFIVAVLNADTNTALAPVRYVEHHQLIKVRNQMCEFWSGQDGVDEVQGDSLRPFLYWL